MCTHDRLLIVFCHDIDFFCHNKLLKVLIHDRKCSALCRDKAWVGAAEARDDRAPLACDRVHDEFVVPHDACDGAQCTSCAHNRLDSVHGVVYCLCYYSWTLFKKKKKKDPQKLGHHNLVS